MRPPIDMEWTKDIFPPDNTNPIPSLPGKMWKLLALACVDMEEIKKDDRYYFDMNVWHHLSDDKCRVCMAGSVLANTLNFDIYEYFGIWQDEKTNMQFDILALQCIDSIRTRNLQEAYYTLYGDDYYNMFPYSKEWIMERLGFLEFEYEDSWNPEKPQLYIKEFWKLVKDLKKLNI